MLPDSPVCFGMTSDWESAVPSLLATPASLSPAVKKPEPIIEKDTSKQKQRGRGSFTYGGAGLYSDYVEEDSAHVEGNERVDMGGASDHCMCPPHRQALTT